MKCKARTDVFEEGFGFHLIKDRYYFVLEIDSKNKYAKIKAESGFVVWIEIYNIKLIH